jgi:hypothetical protein
MRIFKELVAPARRDPDLESILPDDFDLASIGCNPAMGPPDNYPRGGFSRFDGGKRNIPVEGPKFQDKAFLRNSDRSRENKPEDRQEEDRRGVTFQSGGISGFLEPPKKLLDKLKSTVYIMYAN